MGDSTEQLKETMGDVLESVRKDAEEMRAEAVAARAAPSGHVVLNWIQVAMIIGTILGSGAASASVAWFRLNSIDTTLGEVRAFQRANSTEVAALKLTVQRLQQDRREDREEQREDRAAVEKIKTQMAYRLAFEATARAIHPETEW